VNERFYHILLPPGYASGTIAIKTLIHFTKTVDSMLVKRLAAYTHLYSTISEI